MNVRRSARHHYVPQFYLRQFACSDEPQKVMVLEQHGQVAVHQRKSIRLVGFQESLHDFEKDSSLGSIEESLNQGIETPFSQGPTWLKIRSGCCQLLDESDKGPLYGFARHLQLRNEDTLRFIQAENSRFRSGEIDANLAKDERQMHEWLTTSKAADRMLFHLGALDRRVPQDITEIAMMVCRSPIPLRSSTNPTLLVSFPGANSPFGDFFATLRTWWLSLDREWGIFIVAGGPPGFSKMELPTDAAIMINRLFLVQQQEGNAAKFLIADDNLLECDMDWANYVVDSQTQRRTRFLRRDASL